MSNTIKVKFGNHFKVNVPRENAETFEAELTQRGVKFYIDSNKKLLEDFVTYSILKKSSAIVDLVSDSDCIVFAETSEENKILNRYLRLVALFSVLMVVLQIVDKFVHP